MLLKEQRPSNRLDHGEENLNLGFGEEKLKEKQIVNTRNAYNTFSGKRAMETVEFPIDLKA